MLPTRRTTGPWSAPVKKHSMVEGLKTRLLRKESLNTGRCPDGSSRDNLGYAVPMLVGTVVAAASVVVSLLLSPETKGTALMAELSVA